MEVIRARKAILGVGNNVLAHTHKERLQRKGKSEPAWQKWCFFFWMLFLWRLQVITERTRIFSGLELRYMRILFFLSGHYYCRSAAMLFVDENEEQEGFLFLRPLSLNYILFHSCCRSPVSIASGSHGFCIVFFFILPFLDCVLHFFRSFIFFAPSLSFSWDKNYASSSLVFRPSISWFIVRTHLTLPSCDGRRGAYTTLRKKKIACV